MLGDPGLRISALVEVESVCDCSHGAAGVEVGKGEKHTGAGDVGNGAAGEEKGSSACKYIPRILRGMLTFLE